MICTFTFPQYFSPSLFESTSFSECLTLLWSLSREESAADGGNGAGNDERETSRKKKTNLKQILHFYCSDFGSGSIIIYRNYWNRSRPCIILDSKIPRLVLEAFPKVLFLGQFFLDQNIQKGSNKLILMYL